MPGIKRSFLNRSSKGSSGNRSFKGSLGLIIAVAFVAIMLIAFPASRLFFAISVIIGLAVAGALYLWHKYRPIKESDVENKRPLGLS